MLFQLPGNIFLQINGIARINLVRLILDSHLQLAGKKIAQFGPFVGKEMTGQLFTRSNPYSCYLCRCINVWRQQQLRFCVVFDIFG